jgi:ABC-type sugar transport system ATPase subunit
MTGSEHLSDDPRAAPARPGPVVLRAQGLRLQLQAQAIDLELRAGEIVGLAGLEGHGQDEFLRALWAGAAASGRVTREVDGRTVSITSPAVAGRNGVAYVPRDRRSESLFESLSIRENFGMPTLARDRRLGRVRAASTTRRLRDWAERLSIAVHDQRDPVTVLSGGNQQKLLFARWLAADPRVLLLNDPTRGVDLGAKRDIYRLLSNLAANGLGIVMLSTELDEHLELMDRVLVFRENEVCAELTRAELSRHALVSAFFGRGPGIDA